MDPMKNSVRTLLLAGAMALVLPACSDSSSSATGDGDGPYPSFASRAAVLQEATWQDPDAAAVEGLDTRVIVHLFEWRWEDVAQECESFLGPMGYDAVQLSPATENSIVEGRPWYERYQPASYRIDNRSGDRDDYADMIRRCNDAGVEIYQDVIANHMTGVYGGVGTAGATFGEYDYPGIYGYDDFHHCGLTEGDEIEDFNDPTQTTECELVNLADLDTSQEDVRDRVAAHLNDLISLGVDGFRMDAIRHVSPGDTEAILARLDEDVFIYSEVVDPQPPMWSEPYYPFGIVTNFSYSQAIGPAFYDGEISGLHGADAPWQQPHFLPSNESLIFVDNHDNQRSEHGGGHIATHKDGDLYDLATAFMLAYPYGTTRVMSSFAFNESADGPPVVPETEDLLPVHEGGELRCGEGTWVCEHRRASIAPMVRFRSVAGSAPVANWWSGSDTQIAFGRGDRAFIAINRDQRDNLTESLPTGLPEGRYCNILDGHLADGTCTGGVVTVDGAGTASFDVGPLTTVALHVDAVER